MKKYLFFVFFAATVAGVFILSYSLTAVITYVYRYNNYEQAKGAVIGYTIDNSSNKAMVISYTVNNEEYKINSDFTDQEKYPVGSGVVVRYDKENPERYILGDEKVDFISTFVGAGITIVGLVGMLSTFSFKKEEKNTVGEL